MQLDRKRGIEFVTERAAAGFVAESMPHQVPAETALAAAEAGIKIIQTTVGRGQKTVGPAVEGMQGGKRRAECRAGAARALEPLETDPWLEPWMQIESCIGMVVVGIVVDRVGAAVALIGKFQQPVQSTLTIRPGTAAVASADGEVGQVLLVLILDPVQVAGQLVAFGKRVGGIQQMGIVRVIAGGNLAVEDPVDMADIAVEQVEPVPGPAQAAAIVGLLVLAPANVADEAIVIKLDALAPGT